MKREPLLLLAIIIFAFSVRMVGLNFGLPFTYHDDEPIIVNYALSYGAGGLKAPLLNIPPLLSYLLFFEYGIFYLFGLFLGIFKNIKDFGYLFLNNPTVFYLIGRFTFGVLPGTLTALFLYRLGEKIFNKPIGLMAAFFLAINFLHVRDSHYLYLDIPLTMFLIVLFAKSVDLIRTNSRGNYIWMGILVGVVTAIKYFGLPLGPFLIAVLVHNLIVYRDEPGRNLQKIGLFILASVTTFFILNPFAFLEYESFLRKLTGAPFSPQGLWFHLEVSLIGSLGLAMLCCGLLGAGLAVIKKNRAARLLSIFILSYYFIIAARSQRSERYVIPLLPLLLLFGAYFSYSLSEGINRPLAKKMVLISMSCLLVFPSAYKVFLTNKLFLSCDTRTQAYHWIKQNIPCGTVVAMDATRSWFPRLEKEKEQIGQAYDDSREVTFKPRHKPLDFRRQLMLSNPRYPKKTYFIYYMRGSRIRGFHSVYPDMLVDFDELTRRRVEYVIVSSMLGEERYDGFKKKLKESSGLLRSFSPYLDGRKRVKPDEDTTLPAAAFSLKELRARRTLGPYIEIYRLNKS